MKLWFIIAMVGIAPCYGASNLPVPPVRLKILAGTPIVEDVLLDGRGPYRFLLDTGAQTNMMEAGLARELGISAQFQTELLTATGTARVAGGRVGRVSLGTAEAAGQEFLFTGLEGVHALSRDIRGVLGQQFLANFDYTLDFKRHEVVFGVPAAYGDRVPVHMIDGRMAVTTSLGDLVIDSGAGTMLLFRTSPSLAAGEIQGSTGLKGRVSIGKAPELRIGSRVYHPVNAAFDGRDVSPEDGLLPASLFESIYICNSKGYVVVDPKKR